MRAVVSALLTTAAARAPRDDVVAAYVRAHARSTAAAARDAFADPCAQRYVSADFWGRGLGNSVNVALNALALAAGANRTLLVSDDRKFRAGFWKYLGAVEDRWPTKDAVLAAWHAGGGCAKCGTCDEKTGAMTEAVRAFFPMKRQCLDDGTCGDGVSWLLCDDALGPGDARLVHVRGAVTWIAPLMLQNERVSPFLRARLEALFFGNTWGKLFEALLGPTQPAPGNAHALAPILDAKLPAGVERLFDVGVHVRHRRHQPVEAIEVDAATCVHRAIELRKQQDAALRRPAGPTTMRIFVATEMPSRIGALYSYIREATASDGVQLELHSLNVSAVAPSARTALQRLARTDAQAVRAGRDWGELGSERWASVADWLLLARSRIVVGALSSTFSELAGATVADSALLLYDPVRRLHGAARTQHNWPSDDEYLRGSAPASEACFRADGDWPLPQYVRLRPAHAKAWAKHGCKARAAQEPTALRAQGPLEPTPHETNHAMHI